MRDRSILNQRNPIMRVFVLRDGCVTTCLLHDAVYYHESAEVAIEASPTPWCWCGCCEQQMDEVEDRGIVQ